MLNRIARLWLVVGGTWLVSSLPAAAQTAPPLTFDVATVKIAQPRVGRIDPIQGGPGTATPERMLFQQLSLISLLRRAYGTTHPNLLTCPPCGRDTYEIVASVPAGATKDQADVMLQNLLTERFKIKLHHETRTLTTYELTVPSGGSKLKPAPQGGADDVMEVPIDRGNLRVGRARVLGVPSAGGMRLAGFAAPLSAMFLQLEDALGSSPIIDKTGLTGLYTFTLDYDPGYPMRPGAEAELPFPKVPEALERQLGLKLTKGSGQFDAVVIDSAEKVPTEN
jgi:uncharacterized protein (TIGR03435 family)